MGQIYTKLAKNMTAVCAANIKISKEESDKLINTISITFNMRADWQGLRRVPCWDVSESIVQMVNNGNLHLDKKLPWHNCNILKLLLRNHHAYRSSDIELSPAQMKALKLIVENLINADLEVLDQFTTKFHVKMTKSLFDIRRDV